MDKPSFKLIGAPCGQHGQYTFYKAIRLTAARDQIVAIGDFFFLRIWQDSELVSIGELQLLWTDRVSDQTLVSLRLYFLPENTPDGRNLHGEDEVLAINEKVVVRAEDLLSWVSDGAGWRCGRRGVRGDPAPDPTQPLLAARLDFSDVQKEKNALPLEADAAAVVVFSYPRYCRYRALLARLQPVASDWLRDSLVLALGGYAAPTNNTRILYCKDTFEYPELEGHEFVCNHLAPKLKGRPRGRRRRRARSRSASSGSSDSREATPPPRVNTPRRLSLRNGGASPASEEGSDDGARRARSEDRAFLDQLRAFYDQNNEPFKQPHSIKDLSVHALYTGVWARGGYEAVCRARLWREIHHAPQRARRHYERFLLPFENYERRNGNKYPKNINGKTEPNTIDTIDVTDSPLREIHQELPDKPHKRLRTPSPISAGLDNETGEIIKEDINIINKPAEEINREFLDSLPPKKEMKISVKPVEQLLETTVTSDLSKILEDNRDLIGQLRSKYSIEECMRMLDELKSKQMADGCMVGEVALSLKLGNTSKPEPDSKPELAADLKSVNGHAPAAAAAALGSAADLKSSRPLGRSSLRAVRVKPARPHQHNNTPPISAVRTDSASSSPQPAAASGASSASSGASGASGSSAGTINNFGIHHPPPPQTNNHSDDEIVEVPYKPKTPEIIDLDEYPESPQAVKKKKLDILKERGLEVTALPTEPAAAPAPAWPPNPLTPLINPSPIIINPAMQHQIMTQASIFQMYNIIPPNYNGAQPPKVIQATSIFGSSGPEKTVYGNPKDPYMQAPHVLHGAPLKPARPQLSASQPAQDILDLSSSATPNASAQKPAVEIVRIPTVPSPGKSSSAQNLSKNYTLVDGKAVVGSNLEITLVNPKLQTPPKARPPQKRNSNGKFITAKTPTPPKDYKPYAAPSPSAVPKKPPIIVPNYQINSRDDVSPTSSTGSRDSQTNVLQNVIKNQSSLAHMMEMQKSAASRPVPLMDPLYMSALYSSLAGQMDNSHLAMYRDLMANQMRGYPGLMNLGVATPTTKN